MKKLISRFALSNVVLSGLALMVAYAVPSSAGAADLKPVYKAPPPAAPTYNWSGFYIGGHAGIAWSDQDAFWDPLPDSATFGRFPQSRGVGSSGFAGGAQAGYNWQAGTFVFGIEGDWMWTNLSRGTAVNWVTNPGGAVAPDGFTTLSSDTNWIASARGRIGFLLYPQILIYATGGGAWADVNVSASAIRSTSGYSAAASISETVSGWVAGAGVEGMFSNNWIWRLEYLYYDFSSAQSVIANSDVFPTFPSRFRWDDATIQVVRAGLSYKFDWGKAPVMAKY